MTRRLRQRSAESGHDFVLMDSGDALYEDLNPETIGPDDIASAEKVLAAMGVMGYTAMAIGPRDLLGGYESLVSASQQAGIRLLGANLQVDGQRRPIEGYEVLELGSLRVALIGLSTADHSVQVGSIFSSAGIIVTDPIEAAESVIKKLGDQVDIIVLIGNLTGIEIASIGERLSGFDLLFSSGSGRLVMADPISSALRYESGNRGQFLMQLDVNRTGEGRFVDRRQRLESTDGAGGMIASQIHLLGSDWEEDEEVERLFKSVAQDETCR